MKTLRMLVLLMSLTVVANMQAKGLDANSVDEQKMPKQEVDSEPTMAPEVFPEFVGGDAALFRFIADNLTQPKGEKEDDKREGRVTVRFVVTETGQIRSARIVKGIGCVVCDQEALRLVYSMPRWVPATTNGEPVASYYAIPIMFGQGKKK